MRAKYNPLLILLLLVACSQGSELDKKKAELSKLQSEQQSTADRIKKLQAEVATLDTTKKVVLVKPVKVETVATRTFQHFLEVQGTLDSRSNVLVAAKMPGVVTSVNVREGDRVRAGQVLATVDDAVTRQSMEEVRTGLSLANTVYERQKTLWDQKIGTEVQFLQAKNQKESLESRLRTVQSQLGLARIASPINGVVDAVNVKVGETTSPLGVFRVVDPNNLRVIAKVADANLAAVRRGDQVRVLIPDLKQEIDGTISFVSAVINPTTRTFDIQVNVANRDGLLRPNMLVSVVINDQDKPNVVVIRENVVQNSESGSIVYVVSEEGGRKVAKLRPVKLGLRYNGLVEVTEGLAAGQQLITEGYQDLVEGTVVEVK